MPLQRKKQWDTNHFNKFLIDHASKPFEWGVWDCALFAASAVEAITGIDIASDFRGKYTTQLGALGTISKITNGSTVVDAVAHCADKHGLVEHIYPLMAKRGDLVIIDNAGTLIAGVVHLNGRHVISVSETGLVRLPITNIVRAWSLDIPAPSPIAVDTSLPALEAGKTVLKLGSASE